MCGIIGSLARQTDSSGDLKFSEALRMLKHRGPDCHRYEKTEIDGFIATLGHARLSIIDLTNDASQPMTSSNGRFSIVFNGEIYNYLELKSQLEESGIEFKTHSDTEVLLAAWSYWGEACIPKLVGMFAFVVLDVEDKTLTFVRDAFGIKPLFISTSDEGLYFASELPALLTLRGSHVRLNLQRSYDYLVHGDYDSNIETFVEGVNQLPPGCLQIFNISSNLLSEPLRWWAPTDILSSRLSFKQAADKLRELFLNSVRLHLRSDVAVGAALSGGIDSSAVVCAMRYLEPDLPINTFSFIAKDSPLSEEYWVDLVNKRVNAKGHKVVADSHELLRDLDDMIVAQGEPFGSTSIYAQYRVFWLAKQNGVTVTLDGQGADELLAGYNGYPGKRVRSLLAQGEIVSAARFLALWSKWPGRSMSHGLKLSMAEFLSGNLYQSARKLSMNSDAIDWIKADFLSDQGVRLVYPESVATPGSKSRFLINALIDASTKRGLPALLRHADRNSMRFSVESRVPFLTTEIANFTYSLPEEYLISSSGETKSIFRSAMRGIVPDEILDRRDKIGFATPEYEWLKGAIDTDTTWSEMSDELNFLRHEVILEKMKKVFSGEMPFTSQIWRWVNFYRWYDLVMKPLQPLKSS